MNRPSHWILAFLLIAVGTLWGTGALPVLLEASRRPPTVEPTPVETVRVRRDTRSPLEEYGRVHGRVVDRCGWPVIAAEVRVEGLPGSVLTDENGAFELRAPGAAHRRVRIDAPGRHDPIVVAGSVDEILVVAQDPTPWHTVKSVSKPRALLFGEGFVEAPDGDHVPAARVTVRPTGATAITDEIGRFVVPLPNDPFALVCWDGRGGVATTAEQRPSRREGKVPLAPVVLEEGPTLRGRVIDDNGDAVAGAGFLLHNAGVQRVGFTRADGTFEVAGVVPGEAELVVLPHRGRLGMRTALVLRDDLTLPDIRMSRPSQMPLRVQVVDGERVPQPQLHVIADQDAGLHRAYGQTDRHGIVTLSGLRDDAVRFEVRDEELTALDVVSFDEDRRTLIVAR